jgi:peptidoglycan hydrolase-like protein with peptidoglycan-binding domain
MRIRSVLVLAAAASAVVSCANMTSTRSAPTSTARSAAPQPSAEVRDTQQRLHTLGFYQGPNDGLWGPETQAAVQRFQQSHGMTVTAGLNSQTVAAIRTAESAPITVSDATDVRTIQNRLRQLNFYNGQADGVWNPGTQSALENFQRARGLPVGQLTAPTVTAMGIDAATFPTRPNAGMASGATATAGTTSMGYAGHSLDRNVIRGVQRRLSQSGYSPGRVDGVWGPSTQNAVSHFQVSRGLAATGQLDPNTVSALGLDPNNLAGSAAAVR